MRAVLRGALAAAAAAASLALAQDAGVAPPAGLALHGVPPIPARIAEALAPYADFRPHALLSWHPLRREMLVARGVDGAEGVRLVTQPGEAPRSLADSAGAVRYAEFQPSSGASFVFTRAEGGDATVRLYREDMDTHDVTALSAAGERVGAVAWSPAGDRVAYATQGQDRAPHASTALHIVDPMRPGTDRVLARLPGGGWSDIRFSEDGRRLALVEHRSARESAIWLMDASSGRRWRLTRPARGVSYAKPRFTRDARALFAIGDRGSDFRRLVRIALPGGRERVLTGAIAHDVDDFDVSFAAGRIAFTTNEYGSDVLRFIDLASLKEVPRPSLVEGVIHNLRWRPGADEVAFQVASARSAGDVFSYDVRTNQLARWTNGNSPRLNTRGFAEPHVIRWKGPDAREMSGLLYEPPARFAGKRPVVIAIRAGPGSQARPGFIGAENYLVSELGFALIHPNVRGASGFGKKFLALASGPRRVGAVADIGALLGWIAKQPGLDAGRVAIVGTGEGGDLALASAARYGKPLLLAREASGPGEPGGELRGIAASLGRRGIPVGSVVARDGLAKPANAEFLSCATVEFLRHTLR